MVESHPVHGFGEKEAAKKQDDDGAAGSYDRHRLRRAVRQCQCCLDRCVYRNIDFHPDNL
jgi:hypothetical protein